MYDPHRNRHTLLSVNSRDCEASFTLHPSHDHPHCNCLQMDSHGFLFHEDHDDEEGAYRKRNDNADDQEVDSPVGSPVDAVTQESTVQPSWPQSYRQSMDAYSHLASPYIHASPLSSVQRQGNSFLSPHPLASSFRRRTPAIGSRESEPVTKFDQRPTSIPKPSVDTSKKILVPDSDIVSLLPSEVYEAAEGSSALQALFNGVNVLAGVGVLSTPYAVLQGGWLSLCLLFGFALICFYTGLVLRHCLESRPGLETYPDIGQAAFGSSGRLFISIILYVELYACCVEFLILEGDNLSALFPSLSLSLGPLTLGPTHLFVLLSALAVLPTVWLRDLGLLSYVSAGGVLASLVVVGSVLWLGLVEDVVPASGETLPLLRPWGLPVSIGLFGFCYSGHAVFPNLYTSLRDRRAYGMVLLTSFLVCGALYGSMAVAGVLMFGSQTQSQITLNLPRDHFAAQLAVWTTVVNPFTKYALTLTPVALSLEELLPFHPDSRAHRRASIGIRSALVASTVTVALLIPFFGYVMAFIGSFLSMAVSVIIPCACYLRILGKKATYLQYALCCTFMLVGFVCAIAGTYASVSGIIDSWQQPKVTLTQVMGLVSERSVLPLS